MNKNNHINRYIFLAAFFILVCLIYIARLIDMQIATRDYYVTSDKAFTRTLPIQAVRGEVYDRNGIRLIKNSFSYDLALEKGGLSSEDDTVNTTIIKILKVLETNDKMSNKTTESYPVTGVYPDLSYDQTLLSNEIIKPKFTKFLSNNKLDENISCKDFVDFLLVKYGLLSKDNKLIYPNEVINPLLAIRYEMDRQKFDTDKPYIIAQNIDIYIITSIKELSMRGVEVIKRAGREYCFPGYASHILGRVGKIHAEDIKYYRDLDYPMDAIVGIDGIEKAFESHLRGIDGVLAIEEDKYGNRLNEYVKVEPVSGKNVYLTIDIEMQKVSEQALSDNIEYIVTKATTSGRKLQGEDAKAGALSVMDPNSGEVLALASYPTFNLATYNEDYSKLVSDELSPMINRSLEGIYPPGSTFKISTAAAALSYGIITPQTIIQDRGRYSYYAASNYQPRCWLYLLNGGNHGYINVSQAIQHSCNYFFFEVSRLLTIEKMNAYCKQLGLGEYTGIEIPEKKGILAGPEYRDTSGREMWQPGDTLQAAIGQSDNLFSPLQLSVYLSTIVNGGSRYNAHLLQSVNEFYTDKVIYAESPALVGSVNITDEHLQVLKEGMKNVTDNGSAARVFRNYPISLGGKTGTAQIHVKKSDNAIFTAFAPYDKPELVVSCIIENGANGTDAGYAAKDIFDFYFKINKYKEESVDTE